MADTKIVRCPNPKCRQRLGVVVTNQPKVAKEIEKMINGHYIARPSCRPKK